MRALVIERFGDEPAVQDVPEPDPAAGGVVVEVAASGLCRSDWHALMGHDPDVTLPHVPGHEFAGTVTAVGAAVDPGWLGRRVTAPFVYACGACGPCAAGDQQVCLNQQQPGFTQWGSFAQYVRVENAAVNLVALPDQVGFASAAVLGCRFATSFRAVTAIGAVRPGEWVAVHGCGGVGLSAIMIAVAAGARVIAVDVAPRALELARELGAELSMTSHDDVGRQIQELTGGGVHLSLDALGSEATCAASIASLRTRGRHVQVGLLPSGLGLPRLPMHLVIGRELQVFGSHGMAAHAYPGLLALVASGRLQPQRLVTRELSLAAAGAALVAMGSPNPGSVNAGPRPGIAVVTQW